MDVGRFLSRNPCEAPEAVARLVGGFPSMLLYLLLLPKCPLLFKSSMGSMMTNVVLLLAS